MSNCSNTFSIHTMCHRESGVNSQISSGKYLVNWQLDPPQTLKAIWRQRSYRKKVPQT